MYVVGMDKTTKATKNEVREILTATFPEYTGRKFRLAEATTVWVDRIGGGGSWDEIRAAVWTGAEWKVTDPVATPMQAPCGELTLDARIIYAVHSHFCGQDSGITFYYSPESVYVPRRLTA